MLGNDVSIKWVRAFFLTFRNELINIMNKQKIDYTLYLVTDRDIAKRPLEKIVQEAVAGGVTCVQLREKYIDTRKFIEEAITIKKILEGLNVPLIINDRIDIALAVNAEGVHLGQSDMPLEMARNICGDEMIIGISAESVEDAAAAERNGANYVAVSPVFSTPTKTNTAIPLGLDGIRKIKNAVKIPVIGIGGINHSNAGLVIQNGADGVAVVSAIMGASDAEEAARGLRKILLKYKQ
jgi:thiamine-phosphate pyrophosphorylase